MQETFENYLRDGLSLSSLSSVQKFSIKDHTDSKGQCYLGIALPISIKSIFPDCSVTSRRLSYSDKNILIEENLSETESGLCILDNTGTMRKKRKKFKHDVRNCFKCLNIINQLPSSSLTKEAKKGND